MLSLIAPTLSYAGIDARLLEQLKKENVVDTTNTLSTSEIIELIEQNEQLYQESNVDFKILMIPNTNGESIEQYALDVFNTLKIGNEKPDNGLLLLVAKDDRKMRFEVGYGLEGDFTDIEAAHLIRNTLAPNFKNHNYFSGFSHLQRKLIANLSLENSSSNKIKFESLVDSKTENNIINLGKPSKFVTNYWIFALWNFLVCAMLIIYLSPIYDYLLKGKEYFKGYKKLLIGILPIHLLICWFLTGLNILVLFFSTLLLLVTLSYIHHKYDLHSKWKIISIKEKILLLAICFAFAAAFAKKVDKLSIGSVFVVFFYLSVPLFFLWLLTILIVRQNKSLYPRFYADWFKSEESTTNTNNSSDSSSSSSSHSSSSSTNSSSSRDSGGSSGGGGASGSW